MVVVYEMETEINGDGLLVPLAHEGSALRPRR
jgi:hypothetical protein